MTKVRARAVHPWLQLVLLAMAASILRFEVYVFSPLQESIRLSLKMSDNQIAILQGPVQAISLALTAFPFGLLIDRRNRVVLIVALGMVLLAGNVATAFATGFVTLCLARSLVGIATVAPATASVSIIADLFRPTERGRASIGFVIGQLLGTSLAFVAGGTLLSALPQSAGTWRTAMLVLCAPFLMIAILPLILREPVRQERLQLAPSVTTAFRELWAFRGTITVLLVGGIMVMMVDVAAYTWASPMLLRRFAMSTKAVGLLMGVAVFASGMFGPALGGLLVDMSLRRGGPRLALFSMSVVSLLSVPAALFPAMPTPLWAGTLLVAFLTFGTAISVMQATLFTVVLPNDVRGLAMSAAGVISIPFTLGLAPIAVSLLSGALGGTAHLSQALALMSVLASVLGALCFAVGGKFLAVSGSPAAKSDLSLMPAS